MKNNKKVLQLFSIVALFLAVVGISIGFAALSTAMQITGTVHVTPATWKIEFNSATFSDMGTFATDGDATPTVTATTVSGYDIVLTRPGDSGKWTVEVENKGDINAKVSAVNIATPSIVGTAGASKDADEALVTSNVTYDIKWSTGSAVALGDTLAAGEKKYIEIIATYNSEATGMPEKPVTISGKNFNVTFEQDNTKA